MDKPKAYLKFIDPQDDSKYYIYEYIRGMGEMAMYCTGKIVGKKTQFDSMSPQAMVPIGPLKLGIHRGCKCDTYDTIEELECELFLEAFEDY